MIKCPFDELPRKKGGSDPGGKRAAIHRENIKIFSEWMQTVVDNLRFSPVARSWLYIFEGEGLIDKDDFSSAADWLANHRKENKSKAYIPHHLVANDSTREMEGRDLYNRASCAKAYAKQVVEGMLDYNWEYEPERYFQKKYQVYYPILWCEKRDVMTLFRQFMPKQVKAFAGKGWADINSRVNVVKEVRYANSIGLVPVILYCGDLDPAGVRISDTIRSNLNDVAQVMGYEEIGDLKIRRIGINLRIMMNYDFAWIDNLCTSAKDNGADDDSSDLANPKHKDHYKDYVQNYIAEYGTRKCESNVLITNPKAAKEIIQSEIWNYLSQAGHDAWSMDNKAATDEASLYRENLRCIINEAIDEGRLWEDDVIEMLRTGKLLPGSAGDF